MFVKPYNNVPEGPSQTGSPARAVDVSNPASKPSETTLTMSFNAPPVSSKPSVLEDVASVAVDDA